MKYSSIGGETSSYFPDLTKLIEWPIIMVNSNSTR